MDCLYADLPDLNEMYDMLPTDEKSFLEAHTFVLCMPADEKSFLEARAFVLNSMHDHSHIIAHNILDFLSKRIDGICTSGYDYDTKTKHLKCIANDVDRFARIMDWNKGVKDYFENEYRDTLDMFHIKQALLNMPCMKDAISKKEQSSCLKQ